MTDIINLLDESYAGPAWHGPSVKEALAGVTAAVAAQKLDPGRNSIWELVLHLAHGRHLLTERVNHTGGTPFPRAIREPWWPVLGDDTSDAAWQRDVQLLADCHATLVDAVRNASAAQLARRPAPGDAPIGEQLVGLAMHDAYHAGQIRQLALHFAGQPAVTR